MNPALAAECAVNDKTIEEMKSESKWKAVALDLAEHLKRALPTLDDAREDARHLNRQSVVDAFGRQADAARAAIARAERSEGGAE